MTLLASRDNHGVRQRWGTPAAYVAGVEALSGTVVALDVCAEEWSAKAPSYLGPGGVREDALADDVWWPQLAIVGAKHVEPNGRPIAAWGNYPFGNITPFVDRSLEFADKLLTWAHVPPRTDTEWWRKLTDARGPDGDPLAHLTVITGRVLHDIPPDAPEDMKKKGNKQPQGGVVLWQIGGGPGRLPEGLNYASIMTHGAAELARRAAA